MIDSEAEAVKMLKREENFALHDLGIVSGGRPTSEQTAAVMTKLRMLVLTNCSERLSQAVGDNNLAHPIDVLSRLEALSKGADYLALFDATHTPHEMVCRNFQS